MQLFVSEKKNWTDVPISLPHPTVGALSASNSPSALIAQALWVRVLRSRASQGLSNQSTVHMRQLSAGRSTDLLQYQTNTLALFDILLTGMQQQRPNHQQ